MLAVRGERGGGAHGFPYLQDKVEYPVLMGLGMWWPSVIAPSRRGYFALTYAALALCALAVLWFIAALPESRPWIWGASPALLVYTGLNWDMFGILPLAAGIWLWAKGRERAATAVLALAVCTKIFPLLLLGVLLLTSLRKGLRHALELLGISAAVTLAVNLPFALSAGENWLWFFEYSPVREIEPTPYLLPRVHPRAFAPTPHL